jgi:hypothetical protein
MKKISGTEREAPAPIPQSLFDTTPGTYRALTLHPYDYSVFQAGYPFFTAAPVLKDMFGKGAPFNPGKLFQKSSAQQPAAKDDDNHFRKTAPHLFVAFEEMRVNNSVQAQIDAEIMEIRLKREEMETLRNNGGAWTSKQPEVKSLMQKYGVAAFGDPADEPEYMHCYERIEQLQADIARKQTAADHNLKTIKVFRLLSAPPGTSSRTMKVKIADHTGNKGEVLKTTSDQSAAAKMLPVPRP